MKMLIVCCEDVTEETVKKCVAKFYISPKVYNNVQNELDDMFIELRGTMEKLKCLGIDEIPEELNPEELANFNDTFAATEPILSDGSILAMVHEVDQPDEVEVESLSKSVITAWKSLLMEL